jgi:hypothetical protein
VVIGDRIGNQRRIHHQFADPIAFRLLLLEQKVLGSLNGSIEGELATEGRFSNDRDAAPIYLRNINGHVENIGESNVKL